MDEARTVPLPQVLVTRSRFSWRRVAAALLFVGALSLTGYVLLDNRDELLTAADVLTRVSLWWVLAAIAVEAVSYLSYGSAQAALLRIGGVQAPVVGMAGIAMAAQAVANCLPGGAATSAVVTFRRLTRRSVDPVLIGTTVALSAVLYSTALVTLALVGVQLAGPVDAVPDLRLISLIALAVVVGVGLVTVVLVRRRILSVDVLARRAALLDERVRGTRLAFLGRLVPWSERLRTIHLTPGTALRAYLFLLGTWVADAFVLSLAFRAIDQSPPWQGLLLSYCAAQTAAALPFLPGGLGVVEGSLTVALVAYGGQLESTLAAVLLYRLISFWGLIPTGALAYLGLRAAERRGVNWAPQVSP